MKVILDKDKFLEDAKSYWTGALDKLLEKHSEPLEVKQKLKEVFD